MSCEIIQLSAIASLSKKDRKQIARAAIRSRPSRVELEQEPAPRDEKELSTTCKNGRIRQERKEIWRMAEAATRYWSSRLDFQHAVSWAQRMGVPEGRDHPADPEDRDRRANVEKYRAALVRQLLTPAWDAASVAWKQNALARGKYEYTGVKPERIERAIADDLAFLKAHPTRRSNSEAMARNREFKETMRQRIKDVAASRDLSDEDIKGAMTCKHHEIGRFTEQHGVNLKWLLEGKGRIFKSGPTS
jgi:hypothetical protein